MVHSNRNHFQVFDMRTTRRSTPRNIQNELLLGCSLSLSFASSFFHFQGYLVWRVSCYTLFNGFGLPWPPSGCQNQATPFLGSMSEYVRRFNYTFGSSHIASPAYQKRPAWRLRIHTAKFKFKQFYCNKPIQSLIVCRGISSPVTSIHSLYLTWLLYNISYPEGNFERNQLPDSSMNLSSLLSCLKSDLHVSISTNLHQNFFWLHPSQQKFTIFRVWLEKICLPKTKGNREATIACFSRLFVFSSSLTFTLRHSLSSPISSSARVSRRVDKRQAFKKILNSTKNVCSYPKPPATLKRIISVLWARKTWRT